MNKGKALFERLNLKAQMSECNNPMSTMCHINNMLNTHRQKIQYDLPKTSNLTRDTESQHNNRENLGVFG